MTPTRIRLDDLLERYAYVDPASGKKERELRKVRARSAIVVVAPDRIGRVFVLSTWVERCTTDKLIEKMYETHERWKLRILGGEANGMQSIFQDAIIRDAKMRGKALPLTPIYQPTNIDKDTRIRNVLHPLLHDGRLFVRDDMAELKTELAGFPTTPFKDCVDALACAIKMIPPRPTKVEERGNVDAHINYLKQTGAPAWYIEQVARQRRGG